MSEASDKEQAAALLRTHLEAASALRLQMRGNTGDRNDREVLRTWQGRRLTRTYADLLASPRYRLAAQFFLDELYEPRDCVERDEEIGRIVPTLTKMLPASAIHTIALAIEMDALSEMLDRQVVLALRPLAGTPLKVEAITESNYQQAYINCDRQDSGYRRERERQIRLIGDIGRALDRLVRVPLLATLIHAMSVPAKLAGLSELHNFLDSGFQAFKQMRGADEFLATVMGREQMLLDRLLSGAAHAFDLQSPAAGSI